MRNIEGTIINFHGTLWCAGESISLLFDLSNKFNNLVLFSKSMKNFTEILNYIEVLFKLLYVIVVRLKNGDED